MAVRRKTANRLTLFRTCHTCGKSIVTTADTPFVRQIVIGGRQVTCYFCGEACKRASYKHTGWWDGLADARRKAREATRDTKEKNRRYYDTPADLPPMVEFKAKADAIIKERWGIEVEHIREKYTYQYVFYKL